MEEFAKRFSELRKRRNLTQEDIAEKVGVTPQAVSKWEKGVSLPDITLLPQLADILCVTTDELLGRKPKQAVLSDKNDVNKMMFKIKVDSHEGDKVNIQLPVAVLKIFTESGKDIPFVAKGKNGEDYLQGIDFGQLFALVEEGIIGELVSVDTADGDHIYIVVE